MVAVVGATLVALGLALLFLPGPGLAVIAVGLALLSSEFVWARQWLTRLREEMERAGTPREAGPATRGPAQEHGADP